MAQKINVKEGQRYAKRISDRQSASIWKVGAILATGPMRVYITGTRC